MKKNQSLILLISLFLISIIASYFSLKTSIYGPFKKEKINPLTEKNPLEDFQKKDTDRDGLSDFDEQYLYGTSIYLADSDSDGFSDKEEIEAKSNPNDPRSTPLNKEIKEETKPFSFEEKSLKESKVEESSQEPTPEEIRKILKEKGGLSEEILSKIDDETLLKLYRETKEETGIDFKKLEIGEGGGESDLTERLSGLTPAEIRNLLIQGGADPKILEQIPDEVLKTLFLESLKKGPSDLPEK